MGGGGDPSKEARRSEEERQRKVAQSVQAINYAYGRPERAKDIADYQAAVQALLGQDLTRQHTDAQRNTKFALARSGLTGGSYDVDTNQDLAETYQRGVIDTTRKAKGASAQLEAQDQQAKNNLIALAQSGMDATTAAQQAAEGIRVNLANAQSTAGQESVGDLFGKFGTIWKNSQEQQGRKQARYYGGYDNLYSPVAGGG